MNSVVLSSDDEGKKELGAHEESQRGENLQAHTDLVLNACTRGRQDDEEKTTAKDQKGNGNGEANANGSESDSDFVTSSSQQWSSFFLPRVTSKHPRGNVQSVNSSARPTSKPETSAVMSSTTASVRETRKRPRSRHEIDFSDNPAENNDSTDSIQAAFTILLTPPNSNGHHNKVSHRVLGRCHLWFKNQTHVRIVLNDAENDTCLCRDDFQYEKHLLQMYCLPSCIIFKVRSEADHLFHTCCHQLLNVDDDIMYLALAFDDENPVVSILEFERDYFRLAKIHEENMPRLLQDQLTSLLEEIRQEKKASALAVAAGAASSLSVVHHATPKISDIFASSPSDSTFQSTTTTTTTKILAGTYSTASKKGKTFLTYPFAHDVFGDKILASFTGEEQSKDACEGSRKSTKSRDSGGGSSSRFLCSQIVLTHADVDRLEEGQFFNDTILDFYFSFVKRNLYPTSTYHIFSSHFFSQLSSKGNNKKAGEDGKNDLGYANYDRVRKWTKSVDIFSLDYVFVPINDSLHWSVAVICNAGHQSPSKRQQGNLICLENNPKNLDDNDNNEEDQKPFPCILFLDSLKRHQKVYFAKVLRTYLQWEWKEKKQGKQEGNAMPRPDTAVFVEDRCFTPTSLPLLVPNVPIQKNGFDCGVYVILFVLKLLRHAQPIRGKDAKQKCAAIFARNMFHAKHMTEFREYLRQLMFVLKAMAARKESEGVVGEEMPPYFELTMVNDNTNNNHTLMLS